MSPLSRWRWRPSRRNHLGKNVQDHRTIMPSIAFLVSLSLALCPSSTHAALARGVYFICCVAHSTCLVSLTTLLCYTPPCTPRRLLLSRSRGHHLVEASARKSTVGGRGRSAVAMAEHMAEHGRTHGRTHGRAHSRAHGRTHGRRHSRTQNT